MSDVLTVRFTTMRCLLPQQPGAAAARARTGRGRRRGRQQRLRARVDGGQAAVRGRRIRRDNRDVTQLALSDHLALAVPVHARARHLARGTCARFSICHPCT